MSQISSVLRKAQTGYMHWCPGCKEMHLLPSTWTFNGDVEKPSFAESFRHTGFSSHSVERTCHYVLTNGILNFCGDCTHELASKQVPLPELPCI